jgi:hypothetical protein
MTIFKVIQGPTLTRSGWRQSAGAGSVQPARRLEVSSFVIDLIRRAQNGRFQGADFSTLVVCIGSAWSCAASVVPDAGSPEWRRLYQEALKKPGYALTPN